MSGPVKFFRATDSGAPDVLNNAAGTLLSVLDACLVSGYGSITLDTLVVADGVATGTKSTGHGFGNYGSTSIGPVVLIAGAAPAALNGEWRVTSTSATTFTFVCTGVADGTATGTITAKRAPAGWEKPFSSTYVGVYRSLNVQKLRPYLRVDDSVGNLVRTRGYMEMTSVDVGTDPFPTDAQASGGAYTYKAGSATIVPWAVVADDTSVFFIPRFGPATGTYFGGAFFGELVQPSLSVDAYHALLFGQPTNSSTQNILTIINASTGGWVCRPLSQTGTAVTAERVSRPKSAGGLADTAEAYAQANIPFRLYRTEAWDTGTVNFRGVVPGLLGSNSRPSAEGTIIGFGAGDDRCAALFREYTQYGWLDVVGPWE